MMKVQQASDVRTIDISEVRELIADAPDRIAKIVGLLVCEVENGGSVPNDVVHAACKELADVRGGILGALASLEMPSRAPGEIVREVAARRLQELREAKAESSEARRAK